MIHDSIRLESLNLQGCDSLNCLDIAGGKFTALNLPTLPKLQALYCQANLLTTLDLNAVRTLRALNCSSNNLSSLYIKNGSRENILLDFSNNPNLNYICCDILETTAVRNAATAAGYSPTIVRGGGAVSGCPAIVGTDNALANDAIEIQPNPTDDVLYINTDIAIEKAEIYDNTGRLVANFVQPNASIRIAHLPQGVYFMQLHTAQERITKKIVKS